MDQLRRMQTVGLCGGLSVGLDSPTYEDSRIGRLG
jgi:hypothetical protein